ncbi:MAG: TonB family protein [Bacteroidaceae bacterium]|nr:TonB family protein [Bacteroidaceae bacterium]
MLVLLLMALFVSAASMATLAMPITAVSTDRGDSVSIEGRVVNEKGIPIKDVQVVAINANIAGITEADGIFSLELHEEDTVAFYKDGMAEFKLIVDAGYRFKGVLVLTAEYGSWMSYGMYVTQMAPTAQAYCDAGLEYMSDSMGVVPDYQKAAACFYRAMGMEYPLGYYYLGRMFEEGKGVAQNLGHAVALYSKADNVSDAYLRLGNIYLTNEDYTNAARYYNLAYYAGDSLVAQPILDSLFAQGLVTKYDLIDENAIYEVVEHNASFPGGERACYEWLSQNIHYPAVAMEQGIQGRVMVQFVVDRDGSISEIKTLRSPDPALSKEAVRVVGAMPLWIPARQGNRTVRSRFNLPIYFNIR